MIGSWLAGLVRRRGGRLAATAAGMAVAVALIATLGAFLVTSRTTMTQRAIRSVSVDWQVQLEPGADLDTAVSQVTSSTAVRRALPVRFASVYGLAATTPTLAAIGNTRQSSTQQTGAAVVLGMPDGYAATFPGQFRVLAGRGNGVLVAQQTAANLHVAPGDTVHIALSAPPVNANPPTNASVPAAVTVDGVVDLPQANALFQKVGASAAAQPAAPPDNVLLLPQAVFDRVMAPLVAVNPAGVLTQIHVARDPALPPDPASAYTAVIGAAHNLEARLAGMGLVGDNLGAALDAARQDAAYAQMLFLFLGVPGAVLAVLITGTVAGAGVDRRRRDQMLLRTRGLSTRQVLTLAGAEAVIIGVSGALSGLALAALLGRLAFGGTVSDASFATLLSWYLLAGAVGVVVAAAIVLLPALHDLRAVSVVGAGPHARPPRAALWSRLGLDFVLLAAAAVVFWASGTDNYALVLAPEGVPSISVSYWAFLGPTLLWIGCALLLLRLTDLALRHGRPLLTWLVRPLTGPMATTTAALMTRRRRTLAHAIVLLAMAVSFAVSTSTFNATYRQQAEADAVLTNGADVTVSQPPATSSPVSGPQPASAVAALLAAVPGVRHVETLQHRFAYVGADLQDLYGVHPASIGDVAALQDTYFVGGTARQLMATLAARPDAILVSDETVKDFQLHPGDQLNLRLPDATSGAYRTVPFHYVGIVKEFPTAPKDSFFVVNADYIARATGSSGTPNYLIDTGGTGQTQVAARIRQRLGPGPTVTDITDVRYQVGSSLTAVDLAGLTRIELVFGVVLAAAAAGIVLALGLTERRRTFAIVTVLGATRKDLQGLVISEAATITAGGLVAGALIGAVLSRMLVTVLTGVFDPPPAKIAVPWDYLSLTAVAVVIAVALACFAGVRTSTAPAVQQLREL